MPPQHDQAPSEVPNTPFWLLRGERYADVIVVGAGFTGLRVATKLKKEHPEWNVNILESLQQGAAASSRNAGFACFGSPGELISDIEEMGLDAAAELLSQRFEGIRLLQTEVEKYGLSVSNDGGNEVFEVEQEEDIHAIHSRWEELQELWDRAGLPADLWVSESFAGLSKRLLTSGFHSNYEFGIDPQELYDALEKRAISTGVNIHRGVTLEEFHASDKTIHLSTSNGVWNCKYVALCTNAGRNSKTAESIYPGRGQIVVTEPLTGLSYKGNYHMDKGYYYFRNVGDRLLLGGGRHLFLDQETSRELLISQELVDHLHGLIERTLLPGKDVRIEHAWSGIMGFHNGGKKMPLVDSPKKGVYRCMGFGGMGVALSNSAAMKLSSMILNDGS